MSKYKVALQAAMKEVHRNTPRNVVKTGKTGIQKEKMLEAIAFSKARKGGAKIPKKK